ncbi:magnesium transporter [Palaeococcus ferrophilus]|uniref:magnesium transporter n=1 Tax=Palaeococcus ferrophilus TaxID=83868 RepID=UPI00064F866F|nr:magnesium transporter [Palaeococcus ferrophilus]
MGALQELKNRVLSAYRTTLPSLVLSLIIGLFGGTFLGKYFDKVRSSYPGLLVILPGIMGLRGNVFGSLASRFSTMLYLGELEPCLRDRKVLKNVVIAVMLSLIPITLLWAIGVLQGIRKNAFEILLIVISSTILVSLILGYFSAFVTIFSFRRGSDPDSVAAPLVASMGDLLTIPSLIMFILLLEHSKGQFWTSNTALVVLFLFLIGVGRVRRAEVLELKELFITITALALLSVVSGSLLHRYSEIIGRALLLGFIYPALLSSFGNYGSVVAAKTSTKLHLGEIEGYLSGEQMLEILGLFMTTPVIGVALSYLGALVVRLTTGASVVPLRTLVLTYPFMALFVMFYAYTLSYFLFQRNIDPDSVAIPLIANNSDILGTIYTVMLAKMATGM